MARISGVTLPQEKRVEIGLTYIFGVGRNISKNILESTKIDSSVRVKDLSDAQVNTLRDFIEKNYKVEGELRRERLMSVKRLKEIGSYRGSRHTKNLPSRGQRTKTNTRTLRGNKRTTVGSGRKTAANKT
jgi:small subunit ribosomal protein S13